MNRSTGESKKCAAPSLKMICAAQRGKRAGYMPHTGQRASVGIGRASYIARPLAGSKAWGGVTRVGATMQTSSAGGSKPALALRP